jgi:diaminohydroxyphosphoribosylaminopyrimidine deaminase / 5-amino-6-(5-phosphoribosylamino)uracil reductase
VTATDGDRAWLEQAIELSRQCPPSTTAFSVGAILVDADGNELARGYSREADEHVHAEESALGKVHADDPRLPTATIYTSLEPCSQRQSRPKTCTQLILAMRLARVAFAWREPALFVADCRGAETLAEAGIEVVELPELAGAVRQVNGHFRF